jgi:DtxR family Mn-dependent transcriptional regulator
MEHAVSDLLVDRIDVFLGHPEVDPHGDPIPRADGVSLEPPVEPATQSLAECVTGQAFRLNRVLDQSSEFLRSLTESGLALGVTGTVEKNPDGAGLMRIRLQDRAMSLALEAAAKLLVTEE